MIKVEKEVSKDYIIKGFKHFTQLATQWRPIVYQATEASIYN